MSDEDVYRYSEHTCACIDLAFSLSVSFRLNKLYRRKIELHNNLLKTNCKALNYAEGMLSEAEYEPIKMQRQAWQDEINVLEKKIEAFQNGGEL
jgi:hypothetical protein